MYLGSMVVSWRLVPFSSRRIVAVTVIVLCDWQDLVSEEECLEEESREDPSAFPFAVGGSAPAGGGPTGGK